MMNARKKRRIFFISSVLIVLLVGYNYSPYKLEGIGYYYKIGAHRVNSLEKLDTALDYFDTIELDLLYNSETNILDVNHTFGESIGLNFETYLNAFDKEKYPFLWLDIKNLKQDNAEAILKRLLTLLKNKSYPLNKVLIESLHPKALPIFEKVGFKTSYYLPIKLHLQAPLVLEKSIIDIKKIIKEQPNTALSFDYRNYKLIQNHFPNHDKYIWALVGIRQVNQYANIRTILKDKTVHTVLFKYKALKGNR